MKFHIPKAFLCMAVIAVLNDLLFAACVWIFLTLVWIAGIRYFQQKGGPR